MVFCRGVQLAVAGAACYHAQAGVATRRRMAEHRIDQPRRQKDTMAVEADGQVNEDGPLYGQAVTQQSEGEGALFHDAHEKDQQLKAYRLKLHQVADTYATALEGSEADFHATIKVWKRDIDAQQDFQLSKPIRGPASGDGDQVGALRSAVRNGAPVEAAARIELLYKVRGLAGLTDAIKLFTSEHQESVNAEQNQSVAKHGNFIQLLCMRIAMLIKGKSPEQIKLLFQENGAARKMPKDGSGAMQELSKTHPVPIGSEDLSASSGGSATEGSAV